jgi:hypothetical protein
MSIKKSVVRVGIAVAVLGFASTLQSSARASCGEAVNAHAGWIVPNPITSFFFWPPVRSDAAAYVYQWAGLLNNATFYSRVTEYGVHAGVSGDLVSIASASTGALDESTIQLTLYLALAGANRVPRTGEVFVILLPHGTTSNWNTSGGGFGPHAWVNATFPDGNVYPLVYSVIEYYSDAVSTDVAISHELFETYTDPIWGNDSSGHAIGFGWWDDSIDSWSVYNKQELADMCENHYHSERTWTLSGATLTQLWSQTLCTCH